MAMMMQTSATTSGLRVTRGRPSFLAMAARWFELRRSRSALGRLNAAQLRDIGLDAEAAQAEAQRPFWDAPAGWR